MPPNPKLTPAVAGFFSCAVSGRVEKLKFATALLLAAALLVEAVLPKLKPVEVAGLAAEAVFPKEKPEEVPVVAAGLAVFPNEKEVLAEVAVAVAGLVLPKLKPVLGVVELVFPKEKGMVPFWGCGSKKK